MSKKILLADDSITIQKVVRITLADGEYDLITVDNGDEAMTRTREIKPDLVMADVVMPGKDGYQVCEEIKADPELKDIPVLLLAGSFEGFDEMKGARIGAEGYILKPFESQALVGKVEELLARPRPQPEPAAAPPPPTAPVVQPPTPQPVPEVPTAPAPEAFPPFVRETQPKEAEDIFAQDTQQPLAEPPGPSFAPEPASAPPVPEPMAPPPTPEPAPPAPAADDLWAQPAAETPVESVAPEPVVAIPEPVAPFAQPAEQDVWGTMPGLETTSRAEEPPGLIAEAEPIPEAPVFPGEPVSEPEAITFAEDVLPEAQPVAEPIFGEPVAEGIPIEMAPLAPEAEAIPVVEPIAEPEVVPLAEMAGQEIPFAEPEMPEPPMVEPFAPPMAEAIPEAEPFAEAEPIAEAEAVPEVEAIPEAEAVPEAEPVVDDVASHEELFGKPEPPVAAPPAPTPEPAPAAPPSLDEPIGKATEEIASAAASGLPADQLKAVIQETVEAVVWEVVPALAEVMIEERLKKWEKEKG